MFSRILSRSKKKNNDGSSPSSAPGGTASQGSSMNARRSPLERDNIPVEGPRAIFFHKSNSADRNSPNIARSAYSRSPTPPSTTTESKSGVFELDNRLLSMPKQLVAKKASEPNVLANVRAEKMRKSNSQPTLPTRKSADMRTSNRSKAKRDDERGFLDRAFENAASLAFEDPDQNTSREESNESVQDVRKAES